MGNICSISISVDQLFSQCWSCTAEPAAQIRNFYENLDQLKTKLRGLQKYRNDVRRRVEIAERQGMQQLDSVQWWISRVGTVEARVNDIVNQCEETVEEKSKLWFRYKTGKKMVRMLRELDNVKDEGQFDMVALDQITLPPWLEPRPSVPTIGLQSTFDSVWKHLTQEDDEVGILGIYGMGGVGKTTLMTQLNNEFVKTPNCFERIIWVVVSKDARLEKIQDDIGKKIGFGVNGGWDSKNQDENASCIFGALQQKRFLLLLDDLWERIDLRMLGVPFPDKDNKSKVVFTTRSEIVCGKMEAQKKIKVECLAWKEAWDLFRRKVGEDVLSNDPEIVDIAQDVAKECGGLPLALITIGRAMASMQTPQEWRYALEVLRKSAAQFSGMEEEVFSLLKFSCDNLPDSRIKSCFLYIALFPEDYAIRKIDLIDYWIGEGFLEGYASTEEAYYHGYFVIGTLIHACLLEYSTPSNDHMGRVKMHDVIRDMALWMLSKDGNFKDNCVVQTGLQLTRAPEAGKWLLARRVSLMHNQLNKLNEAPNCPSLSTLLLRHNELEMISHSFFECMPTLAVLDLSYNKLTELPSSIKDLVSLQYLNLSWNRNLGLLPPEVGALVKLKYLNLNNTQVESIATEVALGLTQLQVLKIACFMEGVGDDTYLEKLECLKCLDYLDVSIKCIQTFQRLTSSSKLQSCTQHLHIFSFQSLMLDISPLLTMKSLNELSITASGLQYLTVESALEQNMALAQGPNNRSINSNICFHSLADVMIFDCLLRDVTWLTFAPNLRYLSITGCPQMKQVICHEKWQQFVKVEGNIPNLFQKLEVLHVYHLSSLESIIWEALPFPQLKMIRVWSCQQLQKLPLNSTSCNGHKIVIEGRKSWWNNLKWEDDETRNTFLHCFQLRER